jgi:membrane-bound hydrogenase subunit beta
MNAPGGRGLRGLDMQEDNNIVAELGAKFPYLQGKMRVQRDRRIFVEVPAENFAEVFAHLYGPMKFNMLSTITGQDLGANLAAMYHLSRENRILLNLVTAVPKDQPVLQSVTPYFPAADIYEREMVDLLGMQVRGLPPGPRYPLPEGWPDGQYPLRKEWTAKMLEGVAPASLTPASYFPESQTAMPKEAKP